MMDFVQVEGPLTRRYAPTPDQVRGRLSPPKGEVKK
jgi:hypothetical protein